MSSNSAAIPLRVWAAGEVEHPAWCSSAHCCAEEVGSVHESAPAQVGDYTVTAFRPTSGGQIYSTVVIETGPSDDDLMVTLRLHDVPTLVARLLDLYAADVT
jgi:hypothetical protein